MKNFTIKLITFIMLVTIENVATATVVYTDINDVTLTLTAPGQNFSEPINLNADLDTDFFINVSNETQTTAQGSFVGESVTITAPPSITTSFILTDGTIFKPARRLEVGDIIQASSATWDPQIGILAANGTISGFPASAGTFSNQGDKYIAVQFNIGGNTHFGWIRVSVVDYSSVTIKDFAYENVAGQSIQAGDMPTSISNAIFENTTIKNINNTLEVEFANSFNGKIQVVAISGQVVRSVDVNSRSCSIDMTAATTGIYTVVVSGNEGYAAKKVAIQ